VRIPFDNVALSAVVSELQKYVGSFVQEVRQPDEFSISLGLYCRRDQEKGQEALFLLNVHPQFARAHFITRRPSNSATPPVFCSTLRARIVGAQVVAIRQIGGDRILELQFESDEGSHLLVAELMGKHSNLILLDASGRCVATAKWVSERLSSRPILPNRPFEWPPVLDKESIDEQSPTTPAEWISFASNHPDRISPFFRHLTGRIGSPPEEWTPFLSPDSGAYPLDFRADGLEGFPRATLSIALEQYFAHAESVFALESLRSNLRGQLERVLRSRSAAIADIEQTLENGLNSDAWQLNGELLLAFGPGTVPGSSTMEAYDYQGEPRSIALDPTLGFVENANRYFERAKKSKSRESFLGENLQRLVRDRAEILHVQNGVAEAKKLSELEDFQGLAKSKKWLIQQTSVKNKDDRPFEGHRIRQLQGPGGVTVLFGENAESNDYLTLRVAKPNDYWLHVRGSTSAHVVLVTGNAPDRIGKEQLLFAARVAVLNSTSKHAGFVPVDYTLKKYVRKPKSAAKGSAFYTHEKTLHIES
jgi:predicted ribosome quality control (RQC) complex YloA/Tae2 family protein